MSVLLEAAVLTYLGSSLTMPFILAMKTDGMRSSRNAFYRVGRNPEERGIVSLCRLSALILFAPFAMLTVITYYLIERLPNIFGWLFTKRE